MSKLIPLKKAPMAQHWIYKGVQHGYKIYIDALRGCAYAQDDKGKWYKIKS